MAKAESCFHCVYSRWDRNQALWMMGVGMPSRPMCANQEDYPGRMKECPLGRVCRNFRPRPPTPKGETVETIPLGDGYYAYVDAADYEWLSRWKWHLYGGYAARYRNGKYVYLHREIMKPPRGMIVDHKNRNKLDDTRDNLRNATRTENMRNKGKQHGASSRFRGVSYNKDRDKYQAHIYKGEKFFLGLHVEEVEAARAYDHAAVALFGEFARLNFPEEWPPERIREVYAQRDAVLKKLKERRAKIRRQRAKARARRTEGKRQRTAKNKKSRAETRGRRGQERKTASRKTERKTHGAERGTKSERATTEKSKSKNQKAKRQSKEKKGKSRPAPPQATTAANSERRTHDAKRKTTPRRPTDLGSRYTNAKVKRKRRTRPA